MQILNYSITIDAPVGAVWNTMMDPFTYREWTRPFTEGSYYEGSWNKGDEIHFLVAKEDGTASGMYSRIKERINHQFISIEHLGSIENGIIDTTSEAVRKWAPSYENYTFRSLNHQTILEIEMQSDPEYKPMFDAMWPKALQRLKELCEE